MMRGWPIMGFGGFGGIGMIFGFIFFILIVIGVVFLIVWLVRRSSYSATDRTGTKSIELLKERYAKGEVTKEQYENMKKDLIL